MSGTFDEFDELLDEALAANCTVSPSADPLRASRPGTNKPSDSISSTFLASTFPVSDATTGKTDWDLGTSLDSGVAVLGSIRASDIPGQSSLAASSIDSPVAAQTSVAFESQDELGSLRHIPAVFQPDADRLEEYKYEQIEEATQRFNSRLVLGQGGFGKVYKGMLPWKENVEREGAGWSVVAIKVMTQDGFDQANSFHTELKLLGGVTHPNIVRLLGFCLEKAMILVYEFVDLGSVEDLLIDSERPHLTWQHRMRALYQTSCALSFLHGMQPQPIMHRDLKPANILLDDKYNAKLADVGLSRMAPELASTNTNQQTHIQDTTILGTLGYIDPMYLSSGKFRPSSDVYSLGITILQLLTGWHSPKGLVDQVDMAMESRALAEIVDKKAGDWPQHVIHEVVDLAMKCIERRPNDRADLKTAVIPLLKKLMST
mmetsp:Transcript_12582/g.15171  ORF Transcript_12582/g.15171 Transcript_12582/m.15171 type:complete len:431 (-) Transcript_12582:216-1508(-)